MGMHVVEPLLTLCEQIMLQFSSQPAVVHVYLQRVSRLLEHLFNIVKTGGVSMEDSQDDGNTITFLPR